MISALRSGVLPKTRRQLHVRVRAAAPPKSAIRCKRGLAKIRSPTHTESRAALPSAHSAVFDHLRHHRRAYHHATIRSVIQTSVFPDAIESTSPSRRRAAQTFDAPR